MKTLSFPIPWGFCSWILSALCSLQSLRAASLTRSPCQLPAPARASLQPTLPPGILWFFPHAQIKRQSLHFPSFSGINCSQGQTDLCRGMTYSWGFFLFPSVLTYQRNGFMLVHSFPSSGHTDKVISRRVVFFEQESPNFIAFRSKEAQICRHGLTMPSVHSARFT